MTSQVSLNKTKADILFDTACLMIKNGKDRQRLIHPEIEGRINTSFEEVALGGISGIEFRAHVETNIGSGRVKFLVRPADAENRNRLEWAPIFGIEEDDGDISFSAPIGNPSLN